MTASTPNDVHRLFAERFRSGDLDGMMELYDPDAIFILQSGEVAIGADAIREILSGFLRLAETFELEHGQAIESDGIALMLDSWALRGRDPEGNPIEMANRTAGVARRQRNGGDWRIVIDNPWGERSGDPSQ